MHSVKKQNLKYVVKVVTQKRAGKSYFEPPCSNMRL